MSNSIEPRPAPLIALRAAVKFLATCTLPEARELRDKAEAIRHYLKRARAGLAAMNEAAEIKLRSERRAGEFLRETVNHAGCRGMGPGVLPTLPAGITKMESHR